MAILKNEFIEKKLQRNIENSMYTLIYHYNSVQSYKWNFLKNKIFELYSLNILNINRDKQKTNTKFVQMMVIPFRIFFQFCKSNKLNKNFQNSIAGSSCVFFCQNKEQVKNLIQILSNIQSSTTVMQYSDHNCDQEEDKITNNAVQSFESLFKLQGKGFEMTHSSLLNLSVFVQFSLFETFHKKQTNIYPLNIETTCSPFDKGYEVSTHHFDQSISTLPKEQRSNQNDQSVDALQFVLSNGSKDNGLNTNKIKRDNSLQLQTDPITKISFLNLYEFIEILSLSQNEKKIYNNFIYLLQIHHKYIFTLNMSQYNKLFYSMYFNLLKILNTLNLLQRIQQS